VFRGREIKGVYKVFNNFIRKEMGKEGHKGHGGMMGMSRLSELYG